MNQEKSESDFRINLRKSAAISQLQNFTDDKKSISPEVKNAKKRNVWILSALIISILIILALVSAYFIEFGESNSKTDFYREIPELIATVKAKEEGYKTIKISLSLKVQGSKSLKCINKNLPALQSSFVLLLSSLRTGDLESAGFGERLVTELQKRADNLFPGMIKAILVKELLLE